MTARVRALLIAGPTAAGKSALASRLAQEFGGAVVNADSMQVYREWRILSARPTEAECRTAPHRLYGHASIREPYSMGQWLRDMRETLRALDSEGLFPIVAGGTGAYFRALTGGLAEIPRVDPAIRAEIETWIAETGLAAVTRELARQDPETAASTDLQNPRRVARAWEVLKQTGLGLAAWHGRTMPPLLELPKTARVVIAPPREILRERIGRRFDRMMEQGALEEAEAVLALQLPRSLPGMRPVGAPELFACLESRVSRDEAVEAAKVATNRFAKRQMTWFRNQMSDWMWTGEESAECDAKWILGLPSLSAPARKRLR